MALLEIITHAKTSDISDDLLPTRLHYFARAQDGLHICLRNDCPGRKNGKPAFFVSRKNDDAPEGTCPVCHKAGMKSMLVEVVTCRKCGYLFGALQDLGPRRRQNNENTEIISNADFDSFSTELGWAADSFWSYFSVEVDLPYPDKMLFDEDESDDEENTLDLAKKPFEIKWCSICGKKTGSGEGDICKCTQPHIRNIKIFHRQCPDTGKGLSCMDNPVKKLLNCCPNCGARNASGLEPLRRFQESDDEIGLAMAIPLAHFPVTISKANDRRQKKLLCFTDHRQRAAAFPSILEEETFLYDIGRKIVQTVNKANFIDFTSLGEKLSDFADKISLNYDPTFFLPVSRYPDEDITPKIKRNLWLAEVFSYFGIPDSARESAEDLGFVKVRYNAKDTELCKLHSIFSPYNLSITESTDILQILFMFIRQKKAFTLPHGVNPDDPAFGIVTADIGFVLNDKKGIKNAKRWMPAIGKDGTFRQDNPITDFLHRLLNIPDNEILSLGNKIWDVLVSCDLLIENKFQGITHWKLDHERLYVVKPENIYRCNRCGLIIGYSVKDCCPKRGCIGKLEVVSTGLAVDNIISRWVGGILNPQYSSLKSEEHSAQISKPLAKKIEDDFRQEGVDLLSSTTTFEMGINIGDLQKILLRNAPPSGASYVQRVGRAGRGKDKNSVCVTLCRRTKYDADAWLDPANRLMSGTIRTPTVFLKNKFIAQRHFNAVVFSFFLRKKILDEGYSAALKQQIRLEYFLPLENRNKIPDPWKEAFPKDTLFNFASWLNDNKLSDNIKIEIGCLIDSNIKDFEKAIQESIDSYSRNIQSIDNEFQKLWEEYNRIIREKGASASVDVENAIRSLLASDIISVLAKRGFLPRYAFPLDVVSLVTDKTRWPNKDKEVELSRDRGIAIAEFAPGGQIVAHKKIFTSAGLYVVSKTDKPIRMWYSKCKVCGQIRTASVKDDLKGNCIVSDCGNVITDQQIKPFIEPSSFSVRIDKTEKKIRYRRSSLIRQRQGITHFIDTLGDSEFIAKEFFHIALKEEGTLFRYNLGPAGEGFVLCPECGASEPRHSYRTKASHKKLRVFSGSPNCTFSVWPPVAFGHEFHSFCLIIRPDSFIPSIESLTYALQKGICQFLELDTFDIGVSWRWLGKRSNGTAGEIILYDNTPGGAGFVKEGFENWEGILIEAKKACNNCDCLKSCYNCLKNYSNQAYHDILDRKSVIDFLSNF